MRARTCGPCLLPYHLSFKKQCIHSDPTINICWMNTWNSFSYPISYFSISIHGISFILVKLLNLGVFLTRHSHFYVQSLLRLFWPLVWGQRPIIQLNCHCHQQIMTFHYPILLHKTPHPTHLLTHMHTTPPPLPEFRNYPNKISTSLLWKHFPIVHLLSLIPDFALTFLDIVYTIPATRSALHSLLWLNPIPIFYIPTQILPSI